MQWVEKGCCDSFVVVTESSVIVYCNGHGVDNLNFTPHSIILEILSLEVIIWTNKKPLGGKKVCFCLTSCS